MVLTLYYVVPSPPSRAVLLTLKAAEIEATLKTINLIEGEHLKPEFVKINPQHTVPTLTDDDFAVCESHAIMSYLIDKYAKNDSFYPKDLKKKAVVDQRLYFENGVLFTKLREICFPVLFKGRTTINEEAKMAAYEGLGFLEKFLEGNDWVCGKDMTIADFSCVSTVSSFVALGFDLSKHPNIKAWLSRCETEMPGYAEVNEPGAKLLGEMVLKKVKSQ